MGAAAQLYDFGYVRGWVPEAAGGDGLPMMMQAILMEEAGRCLGLAADHRQRAGDGRPRTRRRPPTGQAERFLHADAGGRRFGWFGLTEPDAGSDAGALRTPRGAHRGRLRRQRAASSTSPTPSGCDFGILFARVIDEDGSDHGVTACCRRGRIAVRCPRHPSYAAALDHQLRADLRRRSSRRATCSASSAADCRSAWRRSTPVG